MSSKEILLSLCPIWLQITSCLHSQSNALISSDKKLIEASRKTGLKAFHVTEDEEKLRAFIMN